MLKQRVITALLMLPVFLAGLFATSVSGFALFTGAVVGIAAWEWARMGGLSQQWERLAYAGLVWFFLWLMYPDPAMPVLVLASVFWVGAAWLVLRWPASKQFWEKSVVRLLAGLLVLPGVWAALLMMRMADVQLIAGLPSVLLIFYVFLLVWAADIGAYFSGKAWGRRKLAPAVSPGKSVEGALGGLASVALLATLVALMGGLSVGQWFVFSLFSLVAAVFSIVGDLFESLAKRAVGLKDSSQILPGHGGIMDRIDSVTAAAPVFAMLSYLVGWLQPAAMGAN